MNTFVLFKDSFIHFQTLRSAKKMPFWKVIFYIFFLGFILSLPLIKQGIAVMSDLKQDGVTVTEKLPEFSITNGKMHTDTSTEGFIYQTDSIIFTFDPQGKRTISDIRTDTIGNAVSLALLQDRLVIVFPKTGASVATAALGSDQFEIPYSTGTLDGLSSTELKESFQKSSLPVILKLLLFILILYPTLINLIFTIFIVTLGANLYSKMKRYPLRLLDCLKIVTYCATLPVFISSLICFFNPNFNESTLITLISLLIFFFAVKEEKGTPPTL